MCAPDLLEAETDFFKKQKLVLPQVSTVALTKSGQGKGGLIVNHRVWFLRFLPAALFLLQIYTHRIPVGC